MCHQGLTLMSFDSLNMVFKASKHLPIIPGFLQPIKANGVESGQHVLTQYLGGLGVCAYNGNTIHLQGHHSRQYLTHNTCPIRVSQPHHKTRCSINIRSLPYKD